RWKVLQRDHYRCTACGRSPATNPSVHLEVDHITPVSRGGCNSLHNLQTLCADCNRGKSNSPAHFFSHSVDRPQLPLQIPHERISRQRLPGDQLAQITRPIPPPVRVDVRVQPALERLEIPARDLLIQVRDLPADRL